MLKQTLLAFSSLVAAHAATFTFDTQTDLTDNFDLDVISPDSFVNWYPGYGPQGPFPGSTGGIMHFNNYNEGDSVRFKNGPVFLNSFDISSQYGGGGAGVQNADLAERDYTLILYNAALTPIYQQTMLVAPGGAWETLTFNVPDVSIIRILSTASQVDGTGTGGWWPNLDNIVVNEAIGTPEAGASLALFGLGLAGLSLARRKLS